MNKYFFLMAAIVAEVTGTTLMKFTDGFTRLWPSLGTIVCYSASFWLLSRTLTYIPVGIAYAIWSGIGIVLISLLGWLVHGQRLDLPAIIGMGLICAGVLVINLLSGSTPPIKRVAGENGCKKTRLVIGFFYRSGTELVALTGMKQSVSAVDNPDV
ncbi:EmrE family multidrug efflux SMR transporter [Salmonella enterica]|uniref:EmrE family multidrug efflux SMR transporter n=1 Tax=Salmonella enterica I TaxID=59201 RepID=A0A3R1AVX0_SALET|nr:EmrE family multidrug efflux SMR transporter [Salmonella enterica]MML54678.1 EmrE family multidrug efflux SMR transporter [Salmonella enterica subsp. enterica serovar Kidderminster]